MRRVGCAIVVLLGLSLAGWWLALRSGVGAPVAQPSPTAVSPAVEPDRPAHRGRLSEAPDAALLHSARQRLGADGRQERCGPYRLYTDVADLRLIEACGRLARQMDELYERRYGVRPLGEPAEGIVLFAQIADYRAFASEGGVPLGYAGYALGARGLAVFYAEDQLFDTFLSTLTHELTHLLNRRALGVNLPPWLSEGLADGIGDTATATTFNPLSGINGSEDEAERLRRALTAGQTGGLERLVALRRGEFDAGIVASDYEYSALFVRFLLSEPEMATRFKTFLQRFAAGQEIYSPERLASALGIAWPELDRRFGAWVDSVR